MGKFQRVCGLLFILSHVSVFPPFYLMEMDLFSAGETSLGVQGAVGVGVLAQHSQRHFTHSSYCGGNQHLLEMFAEGNPTSPPPVLSTALVEHSFLWPLISADLA